MIGALIISHQTIQIIPIDLARYFNDCALFNNNSSFASKPV